MRARDLHLLRHPIRRPLSEDRRRQGLGAADATHWPRLRARPRAAHLRFEAQLRHVAPRRLKPWDARPRSSSPTTWLASTGRARIRSTATATRSISCSASRLAATARRSPISRSRTLRRRQCSLSSNTSRASAQRFGGGARRHRQVEVRRAARLRPVRAHLQLRQLSAGDLQSQRE